MRKLRSTVLVAAAIFAFAPPSALAQRALEAGDVAHAVKYRELAERAADWRQSPREKACNGAIFGKWQPNIA